MNRSTLLKLLERQGAIQEQIHGLRRNLDTERAERKEVMMSSLSELPLRVVCEVANAATPRRRET